MKRVKVSKYKTVFQGELFAIQQAKATLPNGKTKTFEKAIRPPSVAIMALDNKKRLLLIKEYRISAKKYEWRLPAGRVEENEKPINAAKRELQEEAGYYPQKIKLLYKTKPSSAYVYVHHVYIATKLVPKKLEAGEFEEITVVPTSLSKAYKMVKEGIIEGKELTYNITKLYWNKEKLLKS